MVVEEKRKEGEVREEDRLGGGGTDLEGLRGNIWDVGVRKGRLSRD